MPNGALYLRVPLTWGIETIKWTNNSVEKIISKLNNWQTNISQPGRNCLIMANNIANTTCLPATTCCRINGLQAKFWWAKLSNNFYIWISWSNICKTLTEGGTGVWNITTMNQTHLSKPAYGIIVSHNSLHARTFTAKYERNNGWWPHRTLVSSPKLLKEGLLSLKDNVTWICGNGSTIRLGNDPWVLVCPIHTRLKPAYQLLANEKVNTLTYGHKEG